MPKTNLILKADVHFGYGLEIDYSALEWHLAKKYVAEGMLNPYLGGDPIQRKTIFSKSFWSDYPRGHAAREAARIVQKDIEDNPYQDKIERFLELTGELPGARSTRLGMKTPLLIQTSVSLVG